MPSTYEPLIRAIQSIFHVSRESAYVILTTRNWLEYQTYLNGPLDPRD